jgi:hypothetical protein
MAWTSRGRSLRYSGKQRSEVKASMTQWGIQDSLWEARVDRATRAEWQPLTTCSQATSNLNSRMRSTSLQRRKLRRWSNLLKIWLSTTCRRLNKTMLSQSKIILTLSKRRETIKATRQSQAEAHHWMSWKSKWPIGRQEWNSSWAWPRKSLS